jgi:hypothetical protein
MRSYGVVSVNDSQPSRRFLNEFKLGKKIYLFAGIKSYCITQKAGCKETFANNAELAKIPRDRMPRRIPLVMTVPFPAYIS